jgi:hypothetical protein
MLDFMGVVPPIGCGSPHRDGNHKGAQDHAFWLHSVAAEFLVLGVISETPHRPFAVCAMNVIPKGDYDPGKTAKMWRLRLLLNQRPTNVKLRTTPYRNKSLRTARWLIKVGDVTLSWDWVSYFYHYLNSRLSREYMGCTLGQDRPLSGRFFC